MVIEGRAGGVELREPNKILARKEFLRFSVVHRLTERYVQFFQQGTLALSFREPLVEIEWPCRSEFIFENRDFLQGFEGYREFGIQRKAVFLEVQLSQ